MRIAGTVAVVTGASGGMGRAVARHLARHGADVALVARRLEPLEGVAAEVRQLGRRALVLPLDVSDADAVERAYQAVVRELRVPGILVNTAGFGVWKPFLDITEDEHRRMMEVMYWGAFHWTRAVLPGMRAAGRGHIVNVSAASGRVALPVTSGFSAAASALGAFSEALHRELLGSGVGVSSLFPGSVRSEFWNERDIPTAGIPALVRYAPRLSPDAVARNVCYCIWLRLPTRTLPVFVALLARINALWTRGGDLILWRWFFPALALAFAVRLLLR